MVRAVTSGLINYLTTLSGSYIPIKVDLFTITLADDVTVYRWTDYDQPVTAVSDSFDSLGPLLSRSRLGVKNTVEVPELVINLSGLDTDLLAGINIKQQIHQGYFDGALLQLSRGVILNRSNGFVNVSEFLGAYPGGLFTGVVSTVRLNAVGAEITVKGANVVFNQYAPKNTWQIPCLHTFCDADCTLAAATFTITNTVGSGPTRVLIPWGSVPAKPSIYNNGTVTITGGVASGQSRSIKAASSAGILLQYPLYTVPAPGDAISVLQGCDKTYNSGSGQSCTDRSNTQHFRGFPFVPPAETAF